MEKIKSVKIHGEEARPFIIDGVVIGGYWITAIGKGYSSLKRVRNPGPAGFSTVITPGYYKELKPELKMSSVASRLKDKQGVHTSSTFVVTLTEEAAEKLDYNYAKRRSKYGRKNISVHQLVMAAFRPIDQYPPEMLKNVWHTLPEEAKEWVRQTVIINHINHDSTDNNVENLEYLTPRENSRKATEHYGGNVAYKAQQVSKDDKRQKITVIDFIGTDLKVSTAS
jgi:hypothetical protein